MDEPIGHSPSSNPAGVPQAGLRPVLGWFSAGTIVVGGVIGTGIFFKPRQIAVDTGGYLGVVLLLWLLCGVVNLCGALTLAELSAMMPQAGGVYVFLRTAYGRLTAFLWAWAEFWVIRSGAIAALAVGMGMTVQELCLQWQVSVAEAWQAPFQKFVAVAAIAVLAAINILGTRHAGWFQNITTLIKAAFIAFLGCLPLLVFRSEALPVSGAADPPWWPPEAPAHLWTGVAAALAGIMWAYDGWGNVTVVAQEIRQPQRNVPRALTGGVMLLILLYLGANLGYHLALPTGVIMQTDNPAREAMYRLAGDAGAVLLLVMLGISILGALNSNILIGPRVLYAVSLDQRRLAVWRRIDPRTGTPVPAIAGLSAWAIALVLLSDLNRDSPRRLFDILTDYCIFGGSLFYLAGVVGVFVLRRRRPDLPRPYRAWGYPWVPAVFVVFYVWFLGGMLWVSPRECLTGLGLLAIGLLVYPLLGGSDGAGTPLAEKTLGLPAAKSRHLE